MSVLGIIGGLGPMATAYFLQLVTQMTDADIDQEHIEIVIHSKPQIPDRTRYILGQSQETPVTEMIKTGNGLVAQGAEVLAIPCITAHYFQKELTEAIHVPVINAIEETVKYLEKHGITKVGIMATDGTMESGIFQKELESAGMEVVIPSQDKQKKVMHLIYENVKAGKKMDKQMFDEIGRELLMRGAQVIILGCTELSLIKRDFAIGYPYLDVMEVLARKAVLTCGKLKEEYDELF